MEISFVIFLNWKMLSQNTRLKFMRLWKLFLPRTLPTRNPKFNWKTCLFSFCELNWIESNLWLTNIQAVNSLCFPVMSQLKNKSETFVVAEAETKTIYIIFINSRISQTPSRIFQRKLWRGYFQNVLQSDFCCYAKPIFDLIKCGDDPKSWAGNYYFILLYFISLDLPVFRRLLEVLIM